jgi:hypothetical protein
MIIHQIYYDDKSKSNCIIDDRVKLYYNIIDPNPFYENEVICDLIPLEQSDRVGVFSHKYNNKLGISLDRIEERNEDIVTFFKINYKNHYWKNFERWHPNGLKALEELKIVFGWDIDFNKQPKHIVYQNHFVADTNIYKRYVKTFLKPVMDYLLLNEHLVNFEPRLPQYKGYKMHPFLLERLFTIYLEQNKYSVHQFNILYEKD